MALPNRAGALAALCMSAALVSACSGEPQIALPTWEAQHAPPLLVELNQQIQAMADNGSVSPVVVVDQFAGFDAIDDTFDGVHPSPSGEAKLAANWARALKPVLDSHPGALPNVVLLGDSITDNHYRTTLWRSLREAGYVFDLVGSQNSYPLRADVADLSYKSEPFDTAHEGHTGWTAAELLTGSDWDPAGGGGLDEWLELYRPDVVALHIGTNDLIIGKLTPAEIAEDIGKIIERLRRSNPDVTILLAQIIPYLPLQEPVDG